MLNDLGELVKSGQTLVDGQLVNKILKNKPVKMKSLSSLQVAEYFRLACVYYDNDEFSAIQCLWPDKQGVFPNEGSCEAEVFKLQQLEF